MYFDEMINFNISNCLTQIANETDLKIVDGVYPISCEIGYDFNKEEIKKLLLMFNPMQKELATYKKALEMACKELEDHPYSCWNQAGWLNYFLQKAGEDHE